MTTEFYVKAETEHRKRAQSALDEATRNLRETLRDAQHEGASVAQLMDWTGYSRRTIFYLLKENTK